MATREFHDERGRLWTVWDVYPTLTERRRRDAGPPASTERRRCVEPRVPIRPSMALGWLAFESRDGERRRLAPIPVAPRWNMATEHELRAWLALAEPAPPSRRLIE